MKPVGIARSAVLIGYLGLALTLVAWNTWIEPRPVVLALLLTPLLLPLRGIVRGRAYTHAWGSFLALGYFALGVWHAAVESERAYGLWIVGSSLLFFGACLAYVRLAQGKAPA